MLRQMLLSLVVLSITAGSAFAACEDVIALARTQRVTVIDQARFQTLASEFCSEYSSSRTRGGSMSLDVKYEQFSGIFGKNRSGQDQAATRLCSSTTGGSARSDAYHNYVEAIAPGAFDAYQQCIRMSAASVQFEVNQNGILPTHFAMTVSNATRVSGQQAQLEVVASEGIECFFTRSGRSTITLPDNAGTPLVCDRENKDVPGAITLMRTNASGGGETMSLRWSAYDPAGNPVDFMAALVARTEELQRRLDALSGSSVVGFVSAECPVGWREYEPARGLFLRGIDSTGTADPGGVRAPGSVQTAAIGAHDHGYAGPLQKYRGSFQSRNSLQPYPPLFWMSSPHASQPDPERRTTPNTGPGETRPANVAVLFCTANQ